MVVMKVRSRKTNSIRSKFQSLLLGSKFDGHDLYLQSNYKKMTKRGVHASRKEHCTQSDDVVFVNDAVEV